MFSWIEKLTGTFRSDDHGSASTEWMVATGIVVMMAVPVLAIIEDGAGSSSEDMIVSIEDTDSMGGDDFHGTEGDERALIVDQEDYIPGADMGVGFADGEDENTAMNSARASQPAFIAAKNGNTRRDKPLTPFARTGDSGSGAVATTAKDHRPYAVPTSPVLVSQRLKVSNSNCVEDIMADVPTENNAEIAPVKVVLASGR
jgi:hypothetical protein